MNRECFTATGKAKVRYSTRAAAKAATPDDAPDMKAYRCQHCGWFHLGHYPTNRTTLRRMRERAQARVSSGYRRPRKP